MSGYGSGGYGAGYFGGYTPPMALRVIAALDPVMTDDFAKFIIGLCQPFEQVDTLARDSSTGDPGWSIILDVARCPVEGLPWLGQLNGTIVDTTLSEADQRLQIVMAAGQKRGRPATMYNAIAPYLTGTKTAIFTERDPVACPSLPAYGLTIVTYLNETADSALIGRILTANKPAGIILNYQCLAKGTYANLITEKATYALALSGWVSYQALLAGV